MAAGKSGSFSLQGSNGVTMKIYWSEEYDVSTNKSTVAIEKIEVTSSWYYGITYYLTGTIKINSKTAITMNSVTPTHRVWIPNLNKYGEVLGDMGSVSVTHESDGSKKTSIAVDLKGYTDDGTAGSGWSVTGSQEITLTTITPTGTASVPTVSKSTVAMLEKVTINTNRKNASYTHDLTYSFGGQTGSIATDVGASYQWTVPDLVAKIPNKTSATCTITCKTKNGSTVIGTNTVSLTLTVPDASVPTASAATVKMGEKVNIYTNRKTDTFRHTLKYSMGTASGTIASDVGGGKAWTPSTDLAANTGNKLSATCTITCETWNGTKLVGTEETQITLTVPDATVPTVSKSAITLGDSLEINTPRKANCYEHLISYKFMDYGSNAAALTRDFSKRFETKTSWTPSSDLAKYINSTRGKLVLTCTTYFKGSDAVVGVVSDAVTITVTIPETSDTRPTVSMTVSPVDSPIDGLYIATKTKVQVSFEASSDYSEISSYLCRVENQVGNTNPHTFEPLNGSGMITVTGEVVDARGYSTVLSENIEVMPYGRPRIIPGEGKSKIVCERCNSDGNPDPGGVYLLIQAGRKYNKVIYGGTQQNYCALSYRWKPDAEDDSAYTEPVELLAKTAESDYVSVILSDIVTSNTAAYNIQLIAADDLGETDVVTITITTAFATFHVPIGGHGFTLGGFHDPSKYDVFDCKFDAEFPRNVSGKVYGLGKLPEIPSGSDFNDYKVFGTYSAQIVDNMANCPSQLSGTLRVWSADGVGDDTLNIMQEYVCCDNSGTYRRRMYLTANDGAWEYGQWSKVAEFTQGITNDWHWRKFSDGTAECWTRRFNTARNIETEFGDGANMYYANCDEIEFPFEFSSVPVVTATVESKTAMILMSWQGSDGSSGATVSKPASYRVVRPTTVNNSSFTIAYHAIGRWKE